MKQALVPPLHQAADGRNSGRKALATLIPLALPISRRQCRKIRALHPARNSPPALILENPGTFAPLPVVSTLVLNLDDRLKLRLDALATHHHKPLPDWAAE